MLVINATRIATGDHESVRSEVSGAEDDEYEKKNHELEKPDRTHKATAPMPETRYMSEPAIYTYVSNSRYAASTFAWQCLLFVVLH